MHKYFEWDDYKNEANIKKHGVSFDEAQKVFFDKKRVYAKDLTHSKVENRYFCFSRVNRKILTVRFTYRGRNIRIIGAGYWKKGKKAYEEKNNLYR